MTSHYCRLCRRTVAISRIQHVFEIHDSCVWCGVYIERHPISCGGAFYWDGSGDVTLQTYAERTADWGLG